MKNKNGFTLIELLTVITLLGLIGTIITINLVNSLHETRVTDCERFVSNIEDSACVYASLSSTDCSRSNCPAISLDVLIQNGYVDEDKLDACTMKEIDKTKTVSVTWNADGEKKCTYNGVREYEG